MSPFSRISNWWNNRHSIFVMLKPSTSEVIISRKLYEGIRAEHENESKLSVLFVRMSDPVGDANTASYSYRNYAMFFNPDWQKHGVTEPRLVLTIPVTIGNKGHVGFQAVQPTANEILSVYGIKVKDEDTFYRVYVKREYINGEPYYLLKRP